MISTLLKESKQKFYDKSSISHIATVTLIADSVATIKALKTIRGFLEAAFEFTKVSKCYMVLKS